VLELLLELKKEQASQDVKLDLLTKEQASQGVKLDLLTKEQEEFKRSQEEFKRSQEEFKRSQERFERTQGIIVEAVVGAALREKEQPKALGSSARAGIVLGDAASVVQCVLPSGLPQCVRVKAADALVAWLIEEVRGVKGVMGVGRGPPCACLQGPSATARAAVRRTWVPAAFQPRVSNLSYAAACMPIARCAAPGPPRHPGVRAARGPLATQGAGESRGR
jgi:hypothetical protein